MLLCIYLYSISCSIFMLIHRNLIMMIDIKVLSCVPIQITSAEENGASTFTLKNKINAGFLFKYV